MQKNDGIFDKSVTCICTEKITAEAFGGNWFTLKAIRNENWYYFKNVKTDFPAQNFLQVNNSCCN